MTALMISIHRYKNSS